MRPGLKRYYEEWRYFHRRMALATTITSALAVIACALLYSSPEVRDNISARRFGFEGPEQYVRRIQLSSLGDPSAQRSTPQIVQPKVQKPQRKGGGGDPRPDAKVGIPARDVEPFRPPGVGDSEADIMARAMLRAGSTPLFQSRELIIEHLVEPEYPAEARERGVEGKVAILALVNERGRVSDAEIVGTPGDFILENAALEAVMQCRFKPYQVDGEAQQVYAMFRFAFRLVN